jgi:hypothetical protein
MRIIRESDYGEMGPSVYDAEYIWCMHCEQAYHKSKIVKGQDCPVSGCDGRGLGIDLDNWEWIRSLHPHYPEVPAQGVVYPLYS